VNLSPLFSKSKLSKSKLSKSKLCSFNRGDRNPVITLTLLHPVQSTPVQSWNFEHNPVVRIGRAVDNEVVLYSAVVSRYHVEIRFNGNFWEVVNLGTNGTYLDGKKVHQAKLTSGSIMRLARSGPNIQIDVQSNSLLDASDTTDASVLLGDGEVDPSATIDASINPAALMDAVHSPERVEELEMLLPEPLVSAPVSSASEFYIKGVQAFSDDPDRLGLYKCIKGFENAAQCHAGKAATKSMVCVECGLPLRVLETVGPYQVVKSLGTAGNTWMAWRDGQMVILKSLRPEWLGQDALSQKFESQAKILCELEPRPGLPKFFEAFEFGGRPYLVSEKMFGSTLEEWVQDLGAVPEAVALQWMMELTQTIGYLHAQPAPGVYLDIRPATLIRPKIPQGPNQTTLTDFGELNIEFEVLDAAGYKAPEHQAGNYTRNSDFFAIGTTLTYLLTSREPAAFYRMGEDGPYLAAEMIPSLRPEVAQLIRQLTHPIPEQRLAHAQDVLEVLRALA
jgi:serine/threonine protein kinase